VSGDGLWKEREPDLNRKGKDVGFERGNGHIDWPTERKGGGYILIAWVFGKLVQWGSIKDEQGRKREGKNRGACEGEKRKERLDQSMTADCGLFDEKKSDWRVSQQGFT